MMHFNRNTSLLKGILFLIGGLWLLAEASMIIVRLVYLIVGGILFYKGLCHLGFLPFTTAHTFSSFLFRSDFFNKRF